VILKFFLVLPFTLIKILASLGLLIVLIVIIYGISVGIRIKKGSKDGKKLAKSYLIVSLPSYFLICIISGILDIMRIMTSSKTDNIYIPEILLAALFNSLFYFLVGFLPWWLYFAKSKRIKSLYPEVEKLTLTEEIKIGIKLFLQDVNSFIRKFYKKKSNKI
jgi:hypothetical protein